MQTPRRRVSGHVARVTCDMMMMMMMMVVVVMRENATFARDDACMRGARLERLVRWWVTDGDSASVDFFSW